jgi:hypothetical protein
MCKVNASISQVLVELMVGKKSNGVLYSLTKQILPSGTVVSMETNVLDKRVSRKGHITYMS